MYSIIMAQEQQESGLDILERNDPAQTKVHVALSDYSDAALSRALQRNEWVKCLVLYLDGVDPAADYTQLCHAIEGHGTLTRIWVSGDSDATGFPASASVVLGLLDSIRGNSNIEECWLLHLENAGPALCRYLDNAEFTPKWLALVDIHVRSADLVRVSDALQKNNKIEYIALLQLPESHYLPIMKGLSNKVTPLRTMAISLKGIPSNTQAIFQAAAKIRLLSTLSVQNVPFPGTASASLVKVIPKCQAKKFSVRILCSDTDASDAKQQLLVALKGNFSFRSVSFKYRPSLLREKSDMLNAADRQLVQFYSDRNDLYAQWVENPTMLPESLWPEALALPAGPEPLFRSLRSVLPKVAEKYMQQRRGKKRKRSDAGDEQE